MNRLFNIIQVLRSASKPIRARELAERLEVSQRTIYRDIAELQMQNVPVMGEAGIGYVLKSGFELPPLMLTLDEFDAALLGAQWVARCGDSTLEKSAGTLIEKINSIVPVHLQSTAQASPVTLPPRAQAVVDALNMSDLRAAIRKGRKVILIYLSEGQRTERVVWPVLIGYFETVRVLAAWCELRQGFRHFRTDRIQLYTVLEEKYPRTIDQLKEDWRVSEEVRSQADTAR